MSHFFLSVYAISIQYISLLLRNIVVVIVVSGGGCVFVFDDGDTGGVSATIFIWHCLAIQTH